MSAAMLQAAVAELRPAPLPVPPEYADVAFEYKLGQDSAEDPKAVCPIKHSHFMAELRREAWYTARRVRQRQLGLKVRHLQPLVIRKAIAND